MSNQHQLLPLIGLCLIIAVITAGCSDDEQTTNDSPPSVESNTQSGKDHTPMEQYSNVSSESSVTGFNKKILPTASIGNNGQAKPATKTVSQPEEGSAEWHVREITTMRLRPFPESDDLEHQKTARRERNLKIVELATRAIALTHKDSQRERLFNVAVHHLMDAERQLAQQGDSQNIEAMYEHAADLFQRDPASKAAAEAAYILAEFAHAKSQRYAIQEPRWLQEFARQARLFSTNFPHEEHRAVSLLLVAGQSCELHRMSEEAIACFTTIQQNFPKNPRATQVVADLRRLNLKGKQVDLAGPTINGSYVQIDDFRGKVVLVVFWATNAKPFLDQFPQLQDLINKLDANRFVVLGVNFDEDEPLVATFLEKNSISWPQIFFTDAKRRGWYNPIASHYGIRNIPMFWLVAQDGKFVDYMVDLNSLESDVRVLLDRDRLAEN